MNIEMTTEEFAAHTSGDARRADEVDRQVRRRAQEIADEHGEMVEVYPPADADEDYTIWAIEPRYR